MIDQITVFLENEKGHLAALCRTLANAGISMHALTVADTTDYGVARIIADKPAEAKAALDNSDFRAILTKVYAIGVPDESGALARLLEVFDDAQINVEYAYCFAGAKGEAVDILRIEAHEGIETLVVKAGCRLLSPSDLYA
jgi:hypothetical protein